MGTGSVDIDPGAHVIGGTHVMGGRAVYDITPLRG
jgi:hypothetical protein